MRAIDVIAGKRGAYALSTIAQDCRIQTHSWAILCRIYVKPRCEYSPTDANFPRA